MEITLRGQPVRLATGGRGLDGDEPLVVLVHGAGMDRTVWQLQSRWLAHHGRRVAAVDLPGHGGSGGEALTTIAALADWLADLVDALGGRAAVVGHSMGALAVLELAAARPERVTHLVVCGAAAAMPVHPGLLTAAGADDPLAARLITSWGLAPRSRLGGHPVPGMWMPGATTALLRRSAPGVLAVDLAACDAHGSGPVEAARRVRCPVTVVCGGDDRMTPVRAVGPLVDALEEAAGDAGVGSPRLVVIEGAGHMMMLEDPSATRTALDAALPAAAPVGRS